MTKTLVRTGARVWSRLSKVKQWMISRFDADFHCIISLSNNFRALSSSCHLVLVEKHISLTFHAHICISSHVARKSWGNFQRWNKRFACGLMNKMPLMLPRSVVQFLSEPLHIFAKSLLSGALQKKTSLWELFDVFVEAVNHRCNQSHAHLTDLHLR